jgi:hypothetical protein
MMRRPANGIVMVKSKDKPPPPFRVGEPILESGLYRVSHAEHRDSHKAILLKGQVFPCCGQCKENVQFELVLAAPELDHDPNFQTFRIYEIPHYPKKETA